MSGGGGHGKKRRGGAHEDEHVNHERWLVSYADMMTLLMVLFIVMFAISQVDQKKFAALKDGLSTGFGATSSAPIGGGADILDGGGAAPPQVVVYEGTGAVTPSDTASKVTSMKDGSTAATTAATTEAAKAEAKRLADIEAQIRAALKSKGLQGAVRFKVTDRGLVVALISDDVFFESASATLRPRGQQVLSAVLPVIRRVPNDVAIEGHANHLKVNSPLYPSNWELSAARAAGVARWFVDSGHVTDTRLSPTGYGSARPLYPENDPRSVRFNRRVDLVLISDQPAAVRALIPRLAPQLSDL